MATTTPNNGWPVPTSTDYVKDGATAIESLGDAIDTSVGEGLLAWQTWAPTLSAGWANGNGTWTARYAQLGKIVFAEGLFTVGSTTTKGTNLDISLPVNAQANALSSCVTTNTVGGAATYLLWFNLNAGTQKLTCFAQSASGSFVLRNNITSTIPATWATGDIVRFNITYEAE